MANNVEIEVTGRDKTDALFNKIKGNVQRKFSDMFSASGEKSADMFTTKFKLRIGANKITVPVAPLLASIGAVMPAVSSLVGAAISGGAAIGAVGLGAALVAQTPAVQKAGANMGEKMMAAMTADASPMIRPVLAGMSQIEDRMDKLRPKFREIFSDAGSFAPQLFNALDKSLDKAVNGFADITDNAGPVVDVLENHIPRAVGATVDALIDMTEDSENTAAALAAAMTLLEGTVRMTGQTFGLLNKALPFTSGLFLKIMDAVDGSAESTDKAKFSLTDFLEGLGDTGEAAQTTTHKIRTLDEMLNDFANEATTAFNAETKFGEVLDEAARAAFRNSAGINANTKKGRENREMLSELARQTRDSAEAMRGMAGGSARANGIMNAGYNAFVKAAQGMGISKKAARELAAALGLIKSKTVTVTTRLVTRRITQAGEHVSGPGGHGTSVRGHRHGGIVSAAAAGGPRGNLVEVGEEGREIVRLPYGSSVMTKGDSDRLMAGGGGGGWAGGTTALEVRAAPRSGDRLMDAVVESLRYRIDRSGGSAESYLGRGRR